MPAGQASLLAASVSSASQALSGQSAPGDPAGTANSTTAETAQILVPGIGAAPAQLVNNLLQADIANGANAGPATTGGPQQTPGINGETAGDANAPAALIAGLQQAANQALARSKQGPGGPSSAATPDASAGRNPAPAADKSVASSAATQGNVSGIVQAPSVPATGPATDAGSLAALVSALKASSTASETASGGKASGTNPTGAAGEASSPSSAALSTTADASGLSQTAPPAGSLPSPEVSASLKLAGQQSSPFSLIGNTLAENAKHQSAAIQSGSDGTLPAAAQLSAPVLPSASAISSTSALDTSNPSQPTTDGGQSPQQQGVQNPGYLYGTAPASLQLHVTNISAGETAASGSLTSLVLDQAAYAVQYSHASGQQMQLHLNPPELGALQVDVSMHDGVLSARIEAQSPTAQQILTDNISQLKDSLTQQGVSFDRIDVHLAGSNSGSGGSGTADKSFAQQQEGGLPWDQQFVQSETDNTVPQAPGPAVRASRAPLTSLDIMA
ncbi:MAG TPA: flagellar hook-length control protein FliK [Planctomycetaceae bacterium]|jgi:flagellar hook-length control protein FliK